ncbi:MAG: TGS domain-containing protein, partial [Coriobacteriales bacterium]
MISEYGGQTDAYKTVASRAPGGCLLGRSEMVEISVTLPDGRVIAVPQGATVADVAAAIGPRLAQAAIAGKVCGRLVDITKTVEDGDQVEIVTEKSPEALGILRHSAAHVMAEAVKDLFPTAAFGIGPAIEDGFYY